MSDNIYSGMFEDELRALARAKQALQEQREHEQAQIDAILAEYEERIAAHKDNIAEIDDMMQRQEQAVLANIEAWLDESESPAEEKLRRKALHHGVSVKTTTVYDYDADKARELVIERKLWDYINKPTLSKSAVKKAIKARAFDLVDYEVREERSVNIGKLGDLLITSE